MSIIKSGRQKGTPPRKGRR